YGERGAGRRVPQPRSLVYGGGHHPRPVRAEHGAGEGVPVPQQYGSLSVLAAGFHQHKNSRKPEGPIRRVHIGRQGGQGDQFSGLRLIVAERLSRFLGQEARLVKPRFGKALGELLGGGFALREGAAQRGAARPPQPPAGRGFRRDSSWPRRSRRHTARPRGAVGPSRPRQASARSRSMPSRNPAFPPFERRARRSISRYCSADADSARTQSLSVCHCRITLSWLMSRTMSEARGRSSAGISRLRPGARNGLATAAISSSGSLVTAIASDTGARRRTAFSPSPSTSRQNRRRAVSTRSGRSRL